MEPITIREILEATGGKLLGGCPDLDRTIACVDTDSRKIRPVSLFVPLVGERFDGHAFIQDALESGASACLTARQRESYDPEKSYILVVSPQRALRDLAAWYKRCFRIPFIAVTGSVGKTTTKDMLAAVLGQRFEVLKTDGNYNNELGLPLTLLRLEKKHEMAVLEMGMSSAGEIDYLSEIVEPDVAIITNIGDAHIEYFGSRENILAAKKEIFHHMRPRGLVVLNGDDPLLRTLEGQLPQDILWCGEAEDASYRASGIRSDGENTMWCTVKTPRTHMEVEAFALGNHMIYPILFAAAVGEYYGLTAEEIRQGIADFSPTKMRMNIIHRDRGITILDDSYNANPQSMRAAVEVLSGARGEYKIAVLGDMLELGILAPTLHEGIGLYLARAGIDCLIAVGEMAAYIASAARSAGMQEVYTCAEKEEALPLLADLVKDQTTILVKASRGMQMERITEYLKSITEDA